MRTEGRPLRTRRIDLAGCANFRDLGGYRTIEGHLTRPGVLFRSDSLHRLTDADLGRVLVDLNLRTALDLRSADEQSRTGILSERERLLVHDLPLLGTGADEPDPGDERTLPQRYLGLLEQRATSFGAAVRYLADPSHQPAVFFCLAGKDRTGLLAALVLALAEVERDDIVADYAMTFEVIDAIRRRIASEVPDLVARWAERSLDAFTASPETMDELIDLVEDRWGGFVRYAATAAGVAPDVVAMLRRSFVVEPTPVSA